MALVIRVRAVGRDVDYRTYEPATLCPDVTGGTKAPTFDSQGNATLENELVNHEHYQTREQAQASIFEFIEVFYNRKRLHSSLRYLSPEQFEAGLN
jgi:transposase InsO family protein